MSPAELVVRSVRARHVNSLGSSAYQIPYWTVWEPGDSTRYNLVFIDAVPINVGWQGGLNDLVGLLVVFEDGFQRENSFFVRAPTSLGQQWNARRWLGRGYQPGCWGGLLPILSVLGWVELDEANKVYSTHASINIGKLLAMDLRDPDEFNGTS